MVNSGLDARTFRYELAVGLLCGSNPSVEIAELSSKVLDWCDQEPFIAYLYSNYVEKVCKIYHKEPKL